MSVYRAFEQKLVSSSLLWALPQRDAPPVALDTLSRDPTRDIRGYTANSYGLAAPDPQFAGFTTRQSKGHRDRSKFTVLVIGGSVTGLSVADAVKKAWPDAEVVVANDRWAYTRPVQMALKPVCLRRFEALGVAADILNGSLVDTLEVRNAVTNTRRVGHPKQARATELSTSLLDQVLKSDPEMVVVLNQLEHALCERAVELGVQVRAGCIVALSPETGTRRLHARLRPAQGSAAEMDLGYPDFVCIADGSSGTTGRELELTLLEESPAIYFVNGLVKIDCATVVRIHAVDDGNGGVLRRTMISHGEAGLAWCAAQVPAGWTGDAEATKRMYCKAVSETAGEVVTPESIVWGGTTPYKTQCRRLEPVVLGSNVFVSGDRAGNNGAVAGLGANMAVGIDVENCLRAISRLRDPNRTPHNKRRAVQADYAERTREARQAAFAHTAAIFAPATR